MKEIAINDLKIDKYYSAPLFLDRNFIILTPDISLKNELMTTIKHWGFNKIYTRGRASDTPGYLKQDPVQSIGALSVDDPSTPELDEDSQQKREASLAYYKKTLTFFSKIFKIFSDTDKIDKTLVADKVSQMRERLHIDRETFLHLPDVKNDDYIIVDSVKSAFLALALSELLKLPTYRQIEIGISAILHDIGMFKIPTQLYKNHRKLTDGELGVIKNHVSIGAQSVKGAGFSQEIVQAIQEHHENFDGSGYPFKSAGNSISLYGRILNVIGAYTAATSKRLFRNKKGTHFGIVDILKQTNKYYDPTITKVFILMLSIYPLGTFVKLMDGKKGVVTKTSMQDPKHPMVKVMLQANNKPFIPMKEIHTFKEKHRIQRALTEDEIANLKNVFRFNDLLHKNSELFES